MIKATVRNRRLSGIAPAVVAALAFLHSSMPQDVEVADLRIEKGQRIVGGVTQDDVIYFRGDTKILLVTEAATLKHVMSIVFTPNGDTPYVLSWHGNRYHEKTMTSCFGISEEDVDLDGTFDLLIVKLEKRKKEYFEIVDPSRLRPLPSPLIRKALEAKAKMGEEQAVIDAFREARKSADWGKDE